MSECGTEDAGSIHTQRLNPGQKDAGSIHTQRLNPGQKDAGSIHTQRLNVGQKMLEADATKLRDLFHLFRNFLCLEPKWLSSIRRCTKKWQ